jgi:hypothetical protein
MDKLIAKLKRHIEQHGPLSGKDLTALIDGLSREDAKLLLKELGFVEMTRPSIGEMYHDAVQRGNPEEIASLKEHWLKEERGTAH